MRTKPKSILFILSVVTMLSISCGKADQAATPTNFTSGNVITPTVSTVPTISTNNNLPIYDPAATLAPSIGQTIPQLNPYVNPGLYAQPNLPTIVPIPQQPLDPSGLVDALSGLNLGGGGLLGNLFGGGGGGHGGSCGGSCY